MDIFIRICVIYKAIRDETIYHSFLYSFYMNVKFCQNFVHLQEKLINKQAHPAPNLTLRA